MSIDPRASNPGLTLRALSLEPGFPSLVTLKRWAARGSLDGALMHSQPIGSRGKTYNLEAARRLLRVPNQPPTDSSPPPQATNAQNVELRARLDSIQSDVRSIKAALDELTATRRALQLKYDAAAAALQEQVALMQARERSQNANVLFEARLMQCTRTIELLLDSLPKLSAPAR